MTVRIKLYPKPSFEGTKVLDGETYRIRVNWNTKTEKYYLTLTGTFNGVVIRNMALVCGKNILKPYGYGQYLGELWLIDGSGLDEDPDFAGLGDRWTLEYTPKP